MRLLQAAAECWDRLHPGSCFKRAGLVIEGREGGTRPHPPQPSNATVELPSHGSFASWTRTSRRPRVRVRPRFRCVRIGGDVPVKKRKSKMRAYQFTPEVFRGMPMELPSHQKKLAFWPSP